MTYIFTAACFMGVPIQCHGAFAEYYDMSGRGQQQVYRIGDEPVAGYTLEQFLGRGGFGEVWRACGPGGIPNALKIIYDLDRKRGGKELRALRLLRNIRHPNLVPLTAYWLKTEDGELLRTAEEFSLEPVVPPTASFTPCVTPHVTPHVAPPGEVPASEHAATGRDGETSVRGTLLLPRESVAIPRSTAAAASPPAPAELIIAMGLAEKSLFDWLQECQAQGQPGVPRDELLTYLEDAARAIDLLNERYDIQHCDIKPQNILLLSGAAQVADFGLAKVIGEVRETSMGAGTIAYGAPEVLLGGGPTAHTDQYSLAISYFELRTGELPFGSEQISDVLLAKQGGAIDLILLPPAEREVIARAASREPEQRFANCLEMVRALRAAAGSGEGVLPARAVHRTARRITKTEVELPQLPTAGRKTWVQAGLAGGAALGVAGTLWLGLASYSSARDTDAGGTLTRERLARAEQELARAEQELAQSDRRLADADRQLAHVEQELVEADRQLAHADAAPPAQDTKQQLEQFPHRWLSFKHSDGRTLCDVSQLVSCQHAIREVRYGHDAELPTDSLSLTSSSTSSTGAATSHGPHSLEIPADTRFVAVQLVYHDGTTSKVQRFDLPSFERR